jgi:hypothetical protein
MHFCNSCYNDHLLLHDIGVKRGADGSRIADPKVQARKAGKEEAKAEGKTLKGAVEKEVRAESLRAQLAALKAEQERESALLRLTKEAYEDIAVLYAAKKAEEVVWAGSAAKAARRAARQAREQEAKRSRQAAADAAAVLAPAAAAAAAEPEPAAAAAAPAPVVKRSAVAESKYAAFDDTDITGGALNPANGAAVMKQRAPYVPYLPTGGKYQLVIQEMAKMEQFFPKSGVPASDVGAWFTLVNSIMYRFHNDGELLYVRDAKKNAARLCDLFEKANIVEAYGRISNNSDVYNILELFHTGLKRLKKWAIKVAAGTYRPRSEDASKSGELPQRSAVYWAEKEALALNLDSPEEKARNFDLLRELRVRELARDSEDLGRGWFYNKSRSILFNGHAKHWMHQTTLAFPLVSPFLYNNHNLRAIDTLMDLTVAAIAERDSTVAALFEQYYPGVLVKSPARDDEDGDASSSSPQPMQFRIASNRRR